MSLIETRREQMFPKLTSAEIDRLRGFGAVAAVFAFWTALRSGKEIHDALLSYMQQSAASSDPRMHQVLELFNTPEGFTFIMIMTLIMLMAGAVKRP